MFTPETLTPRASSSALDRRLESDYLAEDSSLIMWAKLTISSAHSRADVDVFALYLIGMMTTFWIANVSRLGLSLSKDGFVSHPSSSFSSPKQNLEHPGTPCRRGSCQFAWQMNCDTNLWRLVEALVSMNLFLLE